MPSSREYPERPLVGVGGVVIDDDRALLIRRASEPLRGQWSIPGGMLELGETLQEGVVRELLEETGLHVRVLDLIEVFERIIHEPPAATSHNETSASRIGPGASHKDAGTSRNDAVSSRSKMSKPLYHYVIADYLCERISGTHAAASDVTDLEFAREDDLARFHLTETALHILHKAFAMYRARSVGP